MVFSFCSAASCFLCWSWTSWSLCWVQLPKPEPLLLQSTWVGLQRVSGKPHTDASAGRQNIQFWALKSWSYHNWCLHVCTSLVYQVYSTFVQKQLHPWWRPGQVWLDFAIKNVASFECGAKWNHTAATYHHIPSHTCMPSVWGAYLWSLEVWLDFQQARARRVLRYKVRRTCFSSTWDLIHFWPRQWLMLVEDDNVVSDPRSPALFGSNLMLNSIYTYI